MDFLFCCVQKNILCFQDCFAFLRLTVFFIYIKGAVHILRIKKSHRNKDEWIVYNPDNFALHTHCRSFRVALIIRDNVEKGRVPKSSDMRLLVSHRRVTKNKHYRRMLQERIDELTSLTQKQAV